VSYKNAPPKAGWDSVFGLIHLYYYSIFQAQKKDREYSPILLAEIHHSYAMSLASE
jgi:hypothetical protein